MSSEPRLIIVSNRLPVTLERTSHGLTVQPSSGGLVSALLPLFQGSGGAWVGWPGTDYDEQVELALRTEGAPDYLFEPVFFSAGEKANFYDGCCNEIVWPLFHDFQTRCNFDPAYWNSYYEANEKFADAVERVARRGDFIWVHDYHLMMLADCLRSRGDRSKLAYFHHIPFPAPDVFEKLPWRVEILRGLMQFNILGFQTDRDRKNFMACIRRFLRDSRLKKIGRRFLASAEGRHVELGTFPISIDFDSFNRGVVAPEIVARSAEIRRNMGDRKIILGIDRLDYTKGIPERLMAFRTLLRSEPSLCGRVSLVQVVVPSREQIPEYHSCKAKIEGLVGEINGEYARPGWSPVTYLHRCLSTSELLALYRAAHVALVTPLKDGMNLVAKEFCASRTDEQGVLVLSEFAGAAAELKNGALLVNPYDFEGVATALCEALHLSEFHQRLRMQKMRQTLKVHDVFWWCRVFCGRTPSRQAGQAGFTLQLLQEQAVAEAV